MHNLIRLSSLIVMCIDAIPNIGAISHSDISSPLEVANFQRQNLRMDYSRLDAFELDKNEVLLRLSISLFILLVILTAIMATVSLSYDCCVRRKMMRKSKQRKRKVPAEMPRKYMQSYGDAETDVDTMSLNSPHSLISANN